MVHRMPVARFEDKAFVRMVQDEFLFLFSIVVGNNATPMDADACLVCLMVTVSAADGIIHAIDVKCTLYGKRDLVLDHCEVPALVRMCF